MVGFLDGPGDPSYVFLEGLDGPGDPSYVWPTFVLLGVFGGEELLAVFDGWLDGLLSFFPVGWANFAVGFKELKGLDHAERFVDAAAERQVVDDLMTNDTGFVD